MREAFVDIGFHTRIRIRITFGSFIVIIIYERDGKKKSEIIKKKKREKKNKKLGDMRYREAGGYIFVVTFWDYALELEDLLIFSVYGIIPLLGFLCSFILFGTWDYGFSTE